MQPVHQYFQELRGHEIPGSLLSKHIQKKDYFDNGPLHFAARFNSKTPDLLLRMIDMGADIHLRNTCGATFLHVLFRFLEPDHILDCLPLLRRLSVLNFSFLSRDHLGRQPVHLLLKRFHYFSLDTVDNLEEVCAVMKPDLDALDVKGRSTRMLISKSFGRPKFQARVSEFISSFPMSRNSTIKFSAVLSEMNDDWTAWMEWVSIEGRSVWIDSNGETALLALLKYWNHDHDALLSPDIVKKMVGLGSQIEMRDRNGDTALAIATKRGLCLAVKSLIKLQASIHITNNRRDGILRSARTEMRLAKHKGQDELYAMILNCIICLIDLEAYDFPSLRRELWAKWAPDPHCGWEQTESEAIAQDIRILRESGII
jgi:ankyrin repeat protein